MRFLRRGHQDEALPVEADATPPGEVADAAAESSGDLTTPEADAGPLDAESLPARDMAGMPETQAPSGDTAWPEPESAVPDAEVELAAVAEADVPETEATPTAEPNEPGLVDRVAADVAEADPDVTPQDLEPGSVVAEEPPGRPSVVFALAEDHGAPDPLAGGRPAALRLAAVHLRTGQHALARAELEALAGHGRLDEAGLLDLAEVRWRTGDLAGAGDAANALLARGSEEPLALVIAAEAVSAVGRPGEARRLSARALELLNEPLDPLFAGMPRSSIWPEPAPEPIPEAPRRRSRPGTAETDGAPSTASEAFAGGRAALAKGDLVRAALLLGVAMRIAPGFAEDVLRAVSGRDDQPLLALVRGDALRLLGREAEALEAFDRARGRASAAGSSVSHAAPTGPGLFDDDPAVTEDEGA